MNLCRLKAGIKGLLLVLGCTVWFLAPAFGFETRSPFEIKVQTNGLSEGTAVEIHFSIPTNCILYSERLHFLDDNGNELTPTKIPAPVKEMDASSKQEKTVYEQAFTVEVALPSLVNNRLLVRFQGCSNGECFFPEKRTFAMMANGRFEEEFQKTAPATDLTVGSDWAKEMHGFKISARKSGFLPAPGFLEFLDRSASGAGALDEGILGAGQAGLVVTLLLIVAGGLLLNFTPCILPMIPINLAIIGAGSSTESRWEGFRNGTLYGAGMAIAYGALGLVVVLTGAKFGALNSSVWFNLIIAAIFIILALGMFGFLNIDFSRYSSHIGPKKRSDDGGQLIQHLLVFIMGAVSALLAGACVAPVVISVTLMAANIYAKGNIAGLLLPFLLGTGMALPWPFAGAGLGLLPKPGKWMYRVKQGFGVVILLFAIYYGHLAAVAYKSFQDSTSLAAAPKGLSQTSDANLQLASGLRQAREKGLPVLVDFRASWCKNCAAMDATVFQRPEVQKRFESFVVVRYDAERPDGSAAKEVLDHFGVLGLPTFVVLTLEKSNP